MKKFLFLAISLMILSSCTKTGDTNKPEESAANTTSVADTIIPMDELKESNDYLLIDLRERAAYNGFKDEGISRGGHLKGAINIPYTILKFLNDNDISLHDYLVDKGITEEQSIVLYHSDNGKAFDFSRRLLDIGYQDVKFFENLSDWSEDASLELVSYPNYQLIVDAKWVNDLITDKNPDTFENSKYIILEACTGENKDLYNEDHIPDALQFELNNIETEATAFELSRPEDIVTTLLEYGITSDKTVVVYSRDEYSAARVVHMLLWAGVKDVRYLDGGYSAWEDAGYDKDSNLSGKVPETDFGGDIPAKPDYMIDSPDELLNNLQSPEFKLISLRNKEEYSGNAIDVLVSRAGEIEGAIWGYDVDAYLDSDGKLKSIEEIKNMWDELGISEDDKISFTATFSKRACLPWMIAYVLGWEDISVFDGGYYAWQLNTDLPIQNISPEE